MKERKRLKKENQVNLIAPKAVIDSAEGLARPRELAEIGDEVAWPGCKRKSSGKEK